MRLKHQHFIAYTRRGFVNEAVPFRPLLFQELFADVLKQQISTQFFQQNVCQDICQGIAGFNILDLAIMYQEHELAKKWLELPEVFIGERSITLMLINDSIYGDYLVQGLSNKKIESITLLSALKNQCVATLSSNSTLLHYFAANPRFNNAFSKIKNFILTSSTINAQNDQGNTALHEAINASNWSMAQTLLKYHADLNIPNRDKETVQGLLEYRKHLAKIVKTLNQKYPNSTATDFELASIEFLKAANLSFDTIFWPTENAFTTFKDRIPSSLAGKISLSQPAFWELKATDYLRRSDFALEGTLLSMLCQNEIALYSALSNTKKFIPYRYSPCDASVKASEFYDDGTFQETTLSTLKELSGNFTFCNRLTKLYIHCVKDLHNCLSELLEFSRDFSLRADQQGFAYILSTITKDGHIYPLLTIIDTTLKKPIGHFYINTSNNDFKYGTALGLFNRGYSYVKPAPFFNVSIDAQTYNSDQNCALYTLEIINQLCKMWEKNQTSVFAGLAQHAKMICAMQLEKNTSGQNLFHHKSAELDNFSMALKSHLYNIYDNHNHKFEAKSGYDLKKYFLKYRWLIGNTEIFRQQEDAKIANLQIDGLANNSFNSTSLTTYSAKESPLQTYFKNNAIMDTIHYQVKHLKQTNPKQIAVKALVAICLISIGLLLNAQVPLTSLSFISTTLFLMAVIGREHIKNTALQSYARKDEEQIKALAPNSIDAFKTGILACDYYEAQKQSCINRNAICYFRDYYAGLSAKEQNHSIMNDVLLLTPRKKLSN
ncbi:MAG: hypothetical protein JSS07_11650 [Proteobacteria bacterium]|nr:hypothetical protein [Pseudomonadota bacterium]